MDLQRSWNRKIAQAAGAGIIAPAAIVGAALAVGIGGGGLRGLGSLGQALRGPQVPVAEAVGPVPSPSPGSDLLARAARRETEASRRAARTAERRLASQKRQAAARRKRRAVERGSSRPSGAGSTPTPGPAQAPAAAPAPTPTPPPTAPSPIRQVGNAIREVTDQVPVAGEPAGAVVDTIVETAEEVMPLRLP